MAHDPNPTLVICNPVRPSGRVRNVMSLLDGKDDARVLAIEAAVFPPFLIGSA
jgi:hypothetical protein